MKITVVFDPAAAKHHAYAILYDDVLVKVGLFDTEHTEPFIFHTLVVEDQWAGPNGSSVIKLAKAAGHLVGLHQASLEEVQWLSPSVWKRALCKGKAPKVKKINDYVVHKKIRSLLTDDERSIYDGFIAGLRNEETKQDIADAVGMALYFKGRVEHDNHPNQTDSE